ncbi:CBS domain-containing protein [Chloroflexota bacterium]
MYIRDIMTSNVVTIPSSTSVAEAKRIMQAHDFRRLPVVDKGKLVGVVTEHGLEKVSPSKATSLTVWELSYLLDKTTVKEIMEANVVTIGPEATAEEALAVAQGHRVGALVVVDKGRVEGIITTNDFFYKIVNPVLGLGEEGTRVEITGGGEPQALEKILNVINKHCLNMNNLHIVAPPDADKKDVIVHLGCEDISQLKTDLEGEGYKVSMRQR